MFDVASWRVHMSLAQGLQRPDRGRPLFCSSERAKPEKVENPANNTVMAAVRRGGQGAAGGADSSV